MNIDTKYSLESINLVTQKRQVVVRKCSTIKAWDFGIIYHLASLHDMDNPIVLIPTWT